MCVCVCVCVCVLFNSFPCQAKPTTYRRGPRLDETQLHPLHFGPSITFWLSSSVGQFPASILKPVDSMTTQLAVEMLRLFSQGELSGIQVQVLASAAWEDGWGRGCPLAQRLKSAGSSGVHSSNCLRDVVRAAKASGLCCTRAMPYHVSIPNAATIPMYLPHEVPAGMVGNTDHISRLFLSSKDLAADRRRGPSLIHT